MSELWHLRIHLGEIEPKSFYDWLVTRCEVIVCVYEAHDNRPHLHILFKEKDITKSTIIQSMLKKYDTLKGNGSYSCSKTDKLKKKKVGDDEKAKCYVCKGLKDSLPIIIGDAKIDVEAYYKQYWQVNEKASNHNTIAVNSKYQKTKTKTFTERLVEGIFADFEVEVNSIISYHLDTKPNELLVKQYDDSRRTLFRHMILCYGKAIRKINENIIRDTWSTIMNSILATNEYCSNKQADRWFNYIVLNKALI